jgi:hypothetical protein
MTPIEVRGVIQKMDRERHRDIRGWDGVRLGEDMDMFVIVDIVRQRFLVRGWKWEVRGAV